jgi:hypothetical protein
LENVPGLLSCDDGRALATVLRELSAAGYAVDFRVLRAQSLVPQKRKRVFIVGIDTSTVAKGAAFRFPLVPELGRSVREILQREVDSKYKLSAVKLSKVTSSPFFKERPGDKFVALAGPARTLISSYKKGQFSQFVALEGGNPCDLTDLPSGVPASARLFSPRECARLQGFPESFQLPAAGGQAWYKQVGNAVSPPIVAAVAGALLCAWQHAGACSCAGVHAALRLAVEATPTTPTPATADEARSTGGNLLPESSRRAALLARPVQLSWWVAAETGQHDDRETGVATVAALLRLLDPANLQQKTLGEAATVSADGQSQSQSKHIASIM